MVQPRMSVYSYKSLCDGGMNCTDFSGLEDMMKEPGIQCELFESHGQEVRSYKANSQQAGIGLILADWFNDASVEVAEVLNSQTPDGTPKYEVLIYNGMDDIICNWIGGLKWVEEMNWTHREEFNNLQFDDCDSMGYTNLGECKKYKNLTFIKVKDAGHMVPMYRPKEAQIMFNNFLGLN